MEGTVEHGFLGIGSEVAVGIQREGGGQGSALNGEGGGVEDLDGAVGQTSLDLGELLSGAGSGDGFVELGQNDAALSIARAVILIERLAVGNSLDGIGEVGSPVDAAADDGGLGSDAGHVVIVAGVESALGLRHGGGGGVVGVLGDELAAEVAQGGGGVGLFGSVRPGADELDLHGHGRADGAGAQEVGGHTGDDFGEGERADVADDGLFGLDGAFVDELLELHTGGNAGEVTAFIDVGEGVVGVVEVVVPGALVGAADELDVGVVGSDLEHEGLEAVGVVEDDLAAFFGQLDVGVLAGGVFADVVLDDPVNIDALGGERLGGGFLAADEVVGVALVVLVADADQADLNGLGLGGGGVGAGIGSVVAGSVLAAAGHEGQDHNDRKQDRKKLLHLGKSSLKIGTSPWDNTFEQYHTKFSSKTQRANGKKN